MKRVARSRAVLDYLRRVKYVVIGSSLLWCQCTVCFSIGAAFQRPLSARAWLFVHSGIVLTGVGAGSLYFLVIGKPNRKKNDTSARQGAKDAGHGPEWRIQCRCDPWRASGKDRPAIVSP